MSAPIVATVHMSAPIDGIDIRHVTHLEQVEMTLWSRGRLVQTVSLSLDNAETLAAQLHTCARTARLGEDTAHGPA